MVGGFLAVPREVLLDWFPKDPVLLAIYLGLAVRANWQDAKGPLPRQRVVLKRGQLCMDTRRLPEELGVSRQVFRTAVRSLINRQKINPQSNPLGTILTIIDYDMLFLPWPDAQPTNQPTANPLLTQSGQGDMNNNLDTRERLPAAAASPVIHLKLAKPLQPSGRARPKPTDFDRKAAAWLRSRILAVNEDSLAARRADVDSWAQHFRLMRTVDKLDEDRIGRVLGALFDPSAPGFVDDPFLRRRVTSAEKFRRIWDELSACVNSPKPKRQGFDAHCEY